MFVNGAADLLGGLIKDIGDKKDIIEKCKVKKWASALIRIGTSILMIVAVAIHYTITKEF